MTLDFGHWKLIIGTENRAQDVQDPRPVTVQDSSSDSALPIT